MNKSEFFDELQELLQLENKVGEATELGKLEEWDSIAFMVVIAFFDKEFGKKITFEDLSACKTPADLVALADGAIE